MPGMWRLVYLIIFIIITVLPYVLSGVCPPSAFCQKTQWQAWNCTGCWTGSSPRAFRERGLCCSSNDLDICLAGCRMSRAEIEQTDKCDKHCNTPTTLTVTIQNNPPASIATAATSSNAGLPVTSSGALTTSALHTASMTTTATSGLKTGLLTTNKGLFTTQTATMSSKTTGVAFTKQRPLTSLGLQTASILTAAVPNNIATRTNTPVVINSQSPFNETVEPSEDGVCVRHCQHSDDWNNCMADCLYVPYPDRLCKIIWFCLFILGLVTGAILMAIILVCIKHRKEQQKRLEQNLDLHESSDNGTKHGDVISRHDTNTHPTTQSVVKMTPDSMKPRVELSDLSDEEIVKGKIDAKHLGDATQRHAIPVPKVRVPRENHFAPAMTSGGLIRMATIQHSTLAHTKVPDLSEDEIKGKDTPKKHKSSPRRHTDSRMLKEQGDDTHKLSSSKMGARRDSDHVLLPPVFSSSPELSLDTEYTSIKLFDEESRPAPETMAKTYNNNIPEDSKAWTPWKASDVHSQHTFIRGHENIQGSTLMPNIQGVVALGSETYLSPIMNYNARVPIISPGSTIWTNVPTESQRTNEPYPTNVIVSQSIDENILPNQLHEMPTPITSETTETPAVNRSHFTHSLEVPGQTASPPHYWLSTTPGQSYISHENRNSHRASGQAIPDNRVRSTYLGTNAQTTNPFEIRYVPNGNGAQDIAANQGNSTWSVTSTGVRSYLVENYRRKHKVVN